MKRFKKLGLLMTVVIGAVALTACGGKSDAKSVADKFMDGLYKSDLTEEGRKELKDMMHSDFSDEKKNILLDNLSITGVVNDLFSESDKKDMKEMGIDGKLDDVVNAICKKIKVERTDVKEEGDKVTVSYKVSVPKVDEDKIDDQTSEIIVDTQEAITAGKVTMDEGLKDALSKGLDLYVKAYNETNELEDAVGEVELKKENGEWKISKFI